MVLTLFHQAEKRVFRGHRADASPFGHTFGGAVDYAGRTFYEGQPPVHLLLRLNTADPAVGVTLSESEWLPLLCAIRYAACGLGYRVVSDNEVKIFEQSETRPWDDFPYDDYPEHLPEEPIVIEEGVYDPTKIDDALGYAGVFGYDALTPKQYAKLVRYVEKRNLPELFGWSTGEDFLQEGHAEPFCQGTPEDDCPDPSCVNHGRESSMRVFALFQEERTRVRTLWGPSCDSLQIFYLVCPECGAIQTGNQST